MKRLYALYFLVMLVVLVFSTIVFLKAEIMPPDKPLWLKLFVANLFPFFFIFYVLIAGKLLHECDTIYYVLMFLLFWSWLTGNLFGFSSVPYKKMFFILPTGFFILLIELGFHLIIKKIKEIEKINKEISEGTAQLFHI